MKDVRLTMRVRNNRLLSLIEEHFGTVAEMYRQTGLSQSGIGALVNFREAPTNKDGWRLFAVDVATALSVTPSEIWPEHMENVRLKESSADMCLDVAEAQDVIASQPDIAAMRALISKASKGLTDRQIKALECVYGGATLRDVGKELGVTQERVRQMTHKAQRKMRENLLRQGIRELGDVS